LGGKIRISDLDVKSHIDPDLHRRLVETAADQGVTLNAYSKDVLTHAVSSDHV